MLVVGCSLGPFGHLWYSHIVDKLVKGHGVKVTLKKILADQAVAGPFFCSAFFIGMYAVSDCSADPTNVRILK